MSEKPLYTIPISQRPPGYGPLFSKVFFPIVNGLCVLGINSAQFMALPLLLIPYGLGRRLFDDAIGWTKDGYGLIAITVLFAPTSIILTTNTPPSITNLVERDPKTGSMTKLNLPDRLVIMGNHQAYIDWMYIWILACYAGHAKGVIILLKASLKRQFFNFIFLNRSWAADQSNLTIALTQLGQQARAGNEMPTNLARANNSERSAPTIKATGKDRWPLWLIIFPEGTILSDEERAKSLKYATREGTPDFVTLLHPRSTGLLFCLRTLLPQVPDLQLLDVTIGYPGVPYGKYPQEWYGLLPVFLRSVPPPTVHIHLHLYSDLSSPDSEIPSLISKPLMKPPKTIAGDVPPTNTGLATPAESKTFELWLRSVWTEKEKRMKGFFNQGKFESAEGGANAREIVPIRQAKWYHWIAAFGGGGMGTLAVAASLLAGSILGTQR
ncbi:MAG: hypothetical protein TREMPRED_005325 [Tremellales sp. Tagirdzhanova-0007]|nr:MAG: hypothetical protein TREMPRED_005325 [Tremellales sp. Tagirdzhanova-0007]